MSSSELITVTPETVEKTGFFCKMSARKEAGYQRKLAWLKARFDEGLQMRLLGGGERGFIEFIPGDFAWRAIRKAGDYLVIHCLWVVGRSKGKGHSTVLIEEALAAAKAGGFKGVAAVTSTGNWLIDAGILAHHGFESVAAAEPGFDIMVRKLDPKAPDPAFCGGWRKKLEAVPGGGRGLTVFRSDQCPYLDNAVQIVADYAADKGMAFRQIEMTSASEVRRLSPTPYGVFAIVKDGELLAYHYLSPKELAKRCGQ
ncbi:hypothetical protein [Pelagibius sp.]|uniref:hypothetical protein n=1 Tax=Pelagibius sp. TaxID=1931238 RepID=UPI002631D117|nr:hypothetical protein [Pelagibius sp.]